MAGAIALAVPSAEVRAMVAGVDNEFVVSKTEFLQFIPNASNVLVD